MNQAVQAAALHVYLTSRHRFLGVRIMNQYYPSLCLWLAIWSTQSSLTINTKPIFISQLVTSYGQNFVSETLNTSSCDSPMVGCAALRHVSCHISGRPWGFPIGCGEKSNTSNVAALPLKAWRHPNIHQGCQPMVENGTSIRTGPVVHDRGRPQCQSYMVGETSEVNPLFHALHGNYTDHQAS